jgi:hypothetical protein
MQLPTTIREVHYLICLLLLFLTRAVALFSDIDIDSDNDDVIDRPNPIKSFHLSTNGPTNCLANKNP